MSEDRIKLAATLPKGQLNGFADGLLAETLCTRTASGGVPAPFVAVVILDVKKVEVDPETGDRVAVLRIRRAQPVGDNGSLKKVEEVLFDEFSAEHGPVIPFDVQRITKAAFSDVPRSTEEVDAIEERERDAMSPADELRRHLERVHGLEDVVALTDGEAEETHRKEHEGLIAPELDHAADWLGWTRADLELAEIDEEVGARDNADRDDDDEHRADDDPDAEAYENEGGATRE